MSWTKSGVDVAVAAHGAADVGLGLEHQHRPAGVEQVVGGDQAVGPGADDDGVVPVTGSACGARRCSEPAQRLDVA